MMKARFKCYLDPLSSHQNKNVVRVGPPLAKLSGSAHAVHCVLVCTQGHCVGAGYVRQRSDINVDSAK